MKLKILQWNIRGYVNNYNELLLLIKKHNTKVMALQETHIQPYSAIPIPINFSIYTLNTSNAFGGVAILIHNSIQHEPITLNNDFEAIGVKIYSQKQLNVISAYISPNKNFNPTNLQSVFGTFTSSTLIMGDFNSRHPNWGSTYTNRRGRTLANFISQSNFIILNDDSPTHFSTHNTLTHTDISICSPTIAPSCNWAIQDDLCGSDHFPIVTSLFQSQQPSSQVQRPRFIIKTANWVSFNKNSHKNNCSRPVTENINKEAANINKIILQAAHASIPQSNPNKYTHNVPWWNSKLQELRIEKNKCWNSLKRNINQGSVMRYKRANAIFKRELKQSKRKSLEEFTSEINPSTPTEKICANIKRLSGYKTKHGIHCLKSLNSPFFNITDRKQIADELCLHWSNLSCDNNFPHLFQEKKNISLNMEFPQTPDAKALELEKEINLLELKSALQNLKGKTPGYDRITYSMISQLPLSVTNRLLNFYNSILKSHIPQSYKLTIITPILKPKSNKIEINSYRPISLNPCLSKLLDKIISNRLWWFVRNNNFIHNNQVGFKRGKSVTDALLYLDHHVAESLSARKHLSIISLDFAKAFDKIGIHEFATI